MLEVLCVALMEQTGPVQKPVLTYAFCWVCCRPQDTSSKCPKPSYSTVCYTQKGLAYYSDWGTLRNTGGATSRYTHTAGEPAAPPRQHELSLCFVSLCAAR